MIEEELIQEYINRFDKRLGKPGKDYSVSREYIDINSRYIDENRDDFAGKVLKISNSRDPYKDKQHYGVFLSYGLSLSAMYLKGRPECITHQEGFKDASVIKKNLDEVLNFKTETEDATVSNIIEWCVEPGSNVEIEEVVWKGLLLQPVKTIRRTLLPGKKTEIVIVIPPVSVEIDYPDWKGIISGLKINNADIVIADYGQLLCVEDLERKYVIQYQTDTIREYVIISAYEKIRGKITCIGSLAFDVWENDREYELKTVPEIDFSISQTLGSYEQKKSEMLVSDCHFVNSRYQAGAGFASFLGTNTMSFMRDMYRIKGAVSEEMREIASVYSSVEALQITEICSKIIGEKNLYNISLEDMVAVANRIGSCNSFEKADINTRHKSTLGTYKGVDETKDMDRIRNIPSNFATITWKLKDKRMKTVPYENLEIGKYTEKQIIESIVNFYESASTENVAEDYLYLANKAVDTDPSAYFAAKIFMYMLTMDSLIIDSRNEEVKYIDNVDSETYIPVKLPSVPVTKPRTTSYGIFKPNKRPTVIRNNANKTRKYNDVMDIPISDMGFSVRTYNCLNRARIRNVSDISKKTQYDLMRVRNLGKSSLIEITNKMAELGIHLAE